MGAGDQTAVTVLVGVVVIFLLFVGVNVGLYFYAQQNNPAARKKKAVSKKKLKREVMRRGLQPAGE